LKNDRKLILVTDKLASAPGRTGRQRFLCNNNKSENKAI